MMESVQHIIDMRLLIVRMPLQWKDPQHRPAHVPFGS